MDIKWFKIKGYEGLYEWSPQLELVRSVARKGTKGKVLQWNYDHSGRPYVNLSKNSVARKFFKAMLIYSHAHQCEIPRAFDVHHINGDFQCNEISNLQLLSHEEHAKLHSKTSECCQRNNTIFSKAVVALDEHNNVVYRFVSTMEADRQGFCRAAVASACRGRYSTHRGHYYKGYYWYFENEWLAMC